MLLISGSLVQAVKQPAHKTEGRINSINNLDHSAREPFRPFTSRALERGRPNTLLGQPPLPYQVFPQPLYMDMSVRPVYQVFSQQPFMDMSVRPIYQVFSQQPYTNISSRQPRLSSQSGLSLRPPHQLRSEQTYADPSMGQFSLPHQRLQQEQDAQKKGDHDRAVQEIMVFLNVKEIRLALIDVGLHKVQFNDAYYAFTNQFIALCNHNILQIHPNESFNNLSKPQESNSLQCVEFGPNATLNGHCFTAVNMMNFRKRFNEKIDLIFDMNNTTHWQSLLEDVRSHPGVFKNASFKIKKETVHLEELINNLNENRLTDDPCLEITELLYGVKQIVSFDDRNPYPFLFYKFIQALEKNANTLTTVILKRSNIDRSTGPILAQTLLKLPHLTNLHFEETTLDDRAIKELTNIFPHLTNVTHLYFENNKTGGNNEEIAVFVNYLKNVKGLTNLTLKNEKLGQHVEAPWTLLSLSNLTGLTSLNLQHNDLTFRPIIALSCIFRNMNNLKMLNLSSNPLTEAGAKEIAKNLPMLKDLTTLILKDINMGTKGAIACLDAVKQMKHITHIDFEGNAIDDEGAHTLALTLLELKLEHINVSRNNIGDKGASSIAKVLSILKNLKTFDLTQNAISTFGALELAIEMQKIENNTLSKITESRLEKRRYHGRMVHFDASPKERVISLDLRGNPIEENMLEQIKQTVSCNQYATIQIDDQ